MVVADKKTIVCCLRGGLGNQLFQYACALNIAKKFDVSVAFDASVLEGGDVIGRTLEIQNIFPGKLTEMRITTDMPVVSDSSPDALMSEVDKLFAGGAERIALIGYFQNEDYFIGVRDEIKAAMLEFRRRFLPEQNMARHGAAVTVGLHFRRSDYQHFGICADSYYLEAINWFLAKFDNSVQFYVFTDEPQYTTAVLTSHPASSRFAVVQRGSAISDFMWLSTCDHLVIANSSYSWWAAWLGETDGAIIFAPTAPWVLHSADYDPLPARWHKVAGVVAKYDVTVDVAKNIRNAYSRSGGDAHDGGMRTNVVAVVPIYKAELDPIERYSLDRSIAALPGRDIVFIGPRGLDLRYYEENFAAIPFVAFDDHYFQSIQGYNRLLLNIAFYRHFGNYDFMLILQTDAIVLRDELDYWCAQPFDYVGAPWPDGYELFVNAGKFEGSNGKNVKVSVGNGGLSLRRIGKSISLLEEFGGDVIEIFERTGSSEDLFFSFMGALSNDFVMPNEITASRFAVELKPSYYYAVNGGHRPMGGHAWPKYEPDYWKALLPDAPLS